MKSSFLSIFLGVLFIASIPVVGFGETSGDNAATPNNALQLSPVTYCTSPSPTVVRKVWASPAPMQGSQGMICVEFNPLVYTTSKLTTNYNQQTLIDALSGICGNYAQCAKSLISLLTPNKSALLYTSQLPPPATPCPTDSGLQGCAASLALDVDRLVLNYTSATRKLQSGASDARTTILDIDSGLKTGKESVSQASALAQGEGNTLFEKVNLGQLTCQQSYRVDYSTNGRIPVFPPNCLSALSFVIRASIVNAQVTMQPPEMAQGITTLRQALSDAVRDEAIEASYDNSAKDYLSVTSALKNATADTFYLVFDGNCNDSLRHYNPWWGGITTSIFNGTDSLDSNVKPLSVSYQVTCQGRLAASQGVVGISNLPVNSFSTRSHFVTATPAPGKTPPPLNTYYQISENTKATHWIVPTFIHICLCSFPRQYDTRPYFSLGYAANPQHEILGGISAGWMRSAFLTVAADYGQVGALNSPYVVQQFVPQNFTPPTSGGPWKIRWAITLSFGTKAPAK